MKKELKDTPKIIVSDELIDIYLNIDKVNRIDSIKQLSKRELYILLLIVIDNHDDNNKYVKYNCRPFEKEAFEIYKVQNNEKINSVILNKLIENSSEHYIETTNIFDSEGNSLPTLNDIRSIRKYKLKVLEK